MLWLLVQHLSELLSSGRVKVVVLTTPGNPTGAVCPEPMLLDIVQLCKRWVGTSMTGIVRRKRRTGRYSAQMAGIPHGCALLLLVLWCCVWMTCCRQARVVAGAGPGLRALPARRRTTHLHLCREVRGKKPSLSV